MHRLQYFSPSPSPPSPSPLPSLPLSSLPSPHPAGKLQTLDNLLHHLKVDSHRVLLFTQMARMLDILEIFLNYHGHTYLRLDGSTPPLKRQVHREPSNQDVLKTPRDS